jgi:hypothetical protein
MTKERNKRPMSGGWITLQKRKDTTPSVDLLEG